jgi:hypothetical protein
VPKTPKSGVEQFSCKKSIRLATDTLFAIRRTAFRLLGIESIRKNVSRKYLGAGNTSGRPEEILFWYKKGADNRAIFGDYSVKDIKLHDLPK